MDGNIPFRIQDASCAAGDRLKMPVPACRNAAPVVLRVLYLNGLGTPRGGVLPTILRVHGHTVIEPDLPDGSFPGSVTIAQRVFNRHQPDLVVGWSRGGAVAMSIDIGSAFLLLVAPAWKNWGTVATVNSNVQIVHSARDRLVPIDDSRELLRNSELSDDLLIAAGEDHRMIDEDAFMAVLDCAINCRQGATNRRAA